MSLSLKLSSYTDFAAFERMRAEARQDPDAALPAVAAKFEGIFVQRMLSAMRATVPSSGLFDSPASRMFMDLLDREVGEKVTDRGGIGIGEMLVRQLQVRGGPAATGAPLAGPGAESAPPTPVVDLQVRPPLASRSTLDLVLSDLDGPAAPPSPEVSRPVASKVPSPEVDGPPFESPEAFVTALAPHARAAAAELGVDPRVLVAQAALETGWGRSVPVQADGSSSFNFFGIKADPRWSGPSVTKSTLEVIDGVAVRVRAPFRAYASPAESFRDYARFLRDNPRYEDALARVEDPRAFVRGLQSAGYATDPRYAEKILGIMDRAVFDAVPAPTELKLATSAPLQPSEV